MEQYTILLIIIGSAVVLVGGVFSVFQTYRLVEIDAKCRGLKHPKGWGLLTAAGDNQSGLLLYLICRRKHPVLAVTEEETSYMNAYKKKIAVGIVFQVIGAILLIWGLFLTT
jgi:hypothetical protein